MQRQIRHSHDIDIYEAVHVGQSSLHLTGISIYEWEHYAGMLTAELGETGCRVAAERVLGSRRAESRRKVKHVARAQQVIRRKRLHHNYIRNI